MGILDSLNGDQDRQRLQLLADQYKAIGDQLLTEQNPLMRPLLETQQKQIAAQIREIEAKPALPENVASQAPEKRRFLGAEVLPAVTVWHGRDRLVTDLVAESNPDRRNVIALLGQGGMGKSTLATKLVEALGIEARSGEFAESCGFDCAIAFKAFEGSSFDEVAAVLLAGLGIREAGQNSRETIAAIVRGLGQVRALVVLDNLESVLQPPSCVNPGRAVSLEWGDLLNGLAIGSHRSLVMLTSREFPADLADRRLPNAKPNRALVRVETVEQVDEMSAIEILQEYGMQDSPEDLAWIARQVDGHPIYLQLLAANYGEMPGFLRKNPQELAGGLDGELAKQLARQSEAARELARRLCVLRVAIDVQGLTFLRLYRDDDERFRFIWSTPEFQPEEIAETAAILDCLVRGSLVQRQYDPKKCVDEFSMHRVIVEFLERQLGEARSGLLGSVYQFYRSGRTVKNPKTLEDLQPLLEAQYFAFQLGNYSEAKNLIYKLEKYLDPWGYWALKKELCEQVLPHLEQYYQTFMLNRIGIIYRNWGEWNKAEKTFKQCLEIETELGDRSSMASSWGVLGDIERYRGNWDEAERLYRQSLELRTGLGDRSGMATSWGQLGDIERNRGNWDEAERLYRQSLELRTELGDRSGMAAIWGVLGDIERNRGNWDEAERLYRQSLELFTELGDRSGMATSISCLGQNELGRGNLDKAEELLIEALQKMEELGMTWNIAETNFDLAQLWQRRNNPDRAQHHYTIARDLYTQLGAAKDLERIETEFNPQ
jgi:tetratricopeptide (TPR) repeat protein